VFAILISSILIYLIFKNILLSLEFISHKNIKKRLMLHILFLDSTRSTAWAAIKELGERLKWRLYNTQKDLKEEREDTTELKETISQLQGDMVELAFKLGVQK
jgi:hypothetical protein